MTKGPLRKFSETALFFASFFAADAEHLPQQAAEHFRGLHHHDLHPSHLPIQRQSRHRQTRTAMMMTKHSQGGRSIANKMPATSAARQGRHPRLLQQGLMCNTPILCTTSILALASFCDGILHFFIIKGQRLLALPLQKSVWCQAANRYREKIRKARPSFTWMVTSPEGASLLTVRESSLRTTASWRGYFAPRMVTPRSCSSMGRMEKYR